MDGILRNFASHASANDDRICLSEGGWRIGFAEAEAISDRLAAELLARTDGPDGVIAWIGGAGAKRVLAYLAIQKAGLVFCAPNTALNHTQIVAILGITKPVLTLVEAGFEALAARFWQGPVMTARFAPGDTFTPPDVPGEAISHISFTSGSTGTPKLMARSRRDMEHFVRMACRLQALGPGDTTALLGNLWNPTQFTGLASGARTACFDVPRLGAGALAEWMQAQSVSTMMIYPALFRELMAANRSLPNLRCIILIGEALTRADAEAHARICPPDAELLGIYGSMEFAYLTLWRRRADDPIDFEVMPMGAAIDPAELHLIDEAGETVPDGATGEVEVTSHHLPGLYLGNPDLTAQRFRRLPDGRTALRMGDLAYRDYRGIYHSMGRRDQQIKIRGYNVRPTDIELVIQRQGEVGEVAVVARDSARGIRRLVCYFTGEADPGAVRKALSGILPNFMIPSVWHRVEALPKTPSGKVIRGDLPDPLTTPGAPDRQDFVGETEQRLAVLFSEILEIADFSRDDDFFDLGGDSLQAMRLVIEAEALFNRRAPFEKLILHGASVAALARTFDGNTVAGPAVLKAGTGARTLVVTHSHGGHLSDYLEVTHALDHRYRVVGANGRALVAGGWDATMQEMAAHALEVLGGEVAQGRDITLVGYSFGAPIAFELARLLATRDGAPPQLILIDPLAPWQDGRRWLRPVYHALRDGQMQEATRLLRRNAGVALGLRGLSLDDAHSTAWLRYRPQPLALDRALLVRSGAPGADAHAEAWQAATGASFDRITVAGDHLGMMRGENAGPLAQQLQRWIADQT